MLNLLMRIGLYVAALLMLADGISVKEVSVRVVSHYDDMLMGRSRAHTYHVVNLEEVQPQACQAVGAPPYTRTTCSYMGTSQAPTRCELEPEVYGALQVGDRLELRRSRVFSKCIELKREGKTIYESSERQQDFIAAMLMIALAFYFAHLADARKTSTPDN